MFAGDGGMSHQWTRRHRRTSMGGRRMDGGGVPRYPRPALCHPTVASGRRGHRAGISRRCVASDGRIGHQASRRDVGGMFSTSSVPLTHVHYFTAIALPAFSAPRRTSRDISLAPPPRLLWRCCAGGWTFYWATSSGRGGLRTDGGVTGGGIRRVCYLRRALAHVTLISAAHHLYLRRTHARRAQNRRRDVAIFRRA